MGAREQVRHGLAYIQRAYGPRKTGERVTGNWQTAYDFGRLKLETGKASRDVPPMFWIYPRPRTSTGLDHALQLTIGRRKFEFRLRGGDAQ